MRIIAGIHRSRPILGPVEGDRTTRPILDRVKQALFDRLWARGMFPEADAQGYITPVGHALDIFSGTGSLGLEALSRGFDHVTFVESDRNSRARLVDNLRTLELIDQATVLTADALSGAWLNRLHNAPVSLVFLDPPYPVTQDPEKITLVTQLMTRLTQCPGLLAPGAVLILRTHERTPSPTVTGWNPPTLHGYGSMNIAIYSTPSVP